MAQLAVEVKWKKEPDEHDYPAAADYLAMLAAPDVVEKVIQDLRAASVVHKKAKDILRASRLELLPATNQYVRRDLEKIIAGRLMSPILMVRGDLRTAVPAQIADGYHRVCAVYYADENVAIPVKIASLP